jgi:hypothetical protein
MQEAQERCILLLEFLQGKRLLGQLPLKAGIREEDSVTAPLTKHDVVH